MDLQLKGSTATDEFAELPQGSRYAGNVVRLGCF